MVTCRFTAAWMSAACLLLAQAAQEMPDISGMQYKKIHPALLKMVVDGDTATPAAILQKHVLTHPDDLESWFVLSVISARIGKVNRAIECVRIAIEKGLPPERFLAGPRPLLDPLTALPAVQEILAAPIGEPIHGPMVGSVTDHSARIWVRTSTAVPVLCVASPDAELTSPRHFVCAQTRAEEDFTVVLELDQLEPATRYYYRVAVGEDEIDETPSFSFTTFPSAGAGAVFSVGFGGGAGYEPQNERMWDTIRTCAPNAFLFLGDNVYIDLPEYPDIQRYCYYRRQSRPEFRQFVSQTPVFAIYDDHDFGDNDCWCGPEVDVPYWKPAVWRVFKQNWVNPSYGGGTDQPGCWFRFSIANVDFFMLDCRYYRTDPTQPNPSMLGPVQLEWLLNELRQSRGVFKVVASSVPWAPGTKGASLDTWDGYPDERNRIFSFLEEQGISGVVLLSADRHRSDVYRIPRENAYDLYEFESSRLTNVHLHDELPGAVFSYNKSQSFGLLSFDTASANPQVTASIINIDGETVYRQTLSHSDLGGKP